MPFRQAPCPHPTPAPNDWAEVHVFIFGAKAVMQKVTEVTDCQQGNGHRAVLHAHTARDCGLHCAQHSLISC